MRLSNLFTSSCTSSCLVLAFLASQASAYFVITEPNRQSQWVNGAAANLVTWTKGVQDGIDNFDVEMARMSVDGLTLVARNVPSTPFKVNIALVDVPPGDDYFLIFINSTHGVMYATSPRFTVLAAGSLPNTTQPQDGSAVTITASGTPHPTRQFGTTFPATDSGARGLIWGAEGEWRARAVGMGGVMMGCVVGAAWTLFW